MLPADVRRSDGTYTIVSGAVDEEDMVVQIDGENFMVLLEPAPGEGCEVFEYEPADDPGYEPDNPVGEWDQRRQRVGLWDSCRTVSAWYTQGSGAAAPGVGSSTSDQLHYGRPPHGGVVAVHQFPQHSRRVINRRQVRPSRGAYQVSRTVSLADPIPDTEPALFTRTSQTNDVLECYDLVLPLAQHGGFQLDNYADAGPTHQAREPHIDNGIVWDVHRRSGRVYVHSVDESLLSTQAIPELAATHSRATALEGCFLLAVNRRSARLMNPDMVEALINSAEPEDTRRGGLELTFQSGAKVGQDPYLNPRLAFVGTRSTGTRHGERPVVTRSGERAKDIEICVVTHPDNLLVSTAYQVTEEVYLALRRRRLLHPPPPKDHLPLSQQECYEGWARALRELRKERGLVECTNRRDRYSHTHRDREMHFHGSQPPGCFGLQCGTRHGPGKLGKTVSFRRRYAARHLKGRAFHTWESKTLYSLRVQRYCNHAAFRAKRHAFGYWLDVTLDWLKKPQGSGQVGRRQLPPEEVRRRQQALELPPDTVRRLRVGAATQLAQGLNVWEYRLLSFYFDKLRRLHSDELCRWMNSFRMRRVLEAWYVYAVSNPARQTASGGIFGKVAVPQRPVGMLRALRSSRPAVDVWNRAPGALELYRDELSAKRIEQSWRWDASRETSVMRIHRLQERQERSYRRRQAHIEAAHMALSCGSADGSGNVPSSGAYQGQLRLRNH